MKTIKLHEEEYVTLATGSELKEVPEYGKKSQLEKRNISPLGAGENGSVHRLNASAAPTTKQNHIASSIATITCLRLAKNR